jgi:hypothetical protein
MKKLSEEFVISVGLLLISFFIFQFAIFPGLFPESLTATVLNTTVNEYNLRPSTKAPGTFTFNYKFAPAGKVTPEEDFDVPILPFNEQKAGQITDLGHIRDAWGYPVRENAYNRMPESRKGVALRSDADPLVLGQVNCRATTSVTGYFKAFPYNWINLLKNLPIDFNSNNWVTILNIHSFTGHLNF